MLNFAIRIHLASRASKNIAIGIKIFEIAVVVTPVSRATIAIVIPYRSINSRAIFFRILLICRRLRS